MRLKYFTLGIIILLCARSAHAAQTIDKRQYVDWNSYPYNQIVAFQHELPSGYVQDCTAQYVAKDIILTARHCITKQLGHDNWTEKNKQEYRIYLPNKTFTKDLVLEQYGHDTYNNDWALLRITNPEFYSETPLSLDSATHIGNVTSAGFGYMRILNDDEIQEIRDHLNNHCTNINNQYCTSGCTSNCINSLIQLDDTNTDYTIRYRNGNKTYITRNIINHLKAHPNCQITNTASGITTHLAGETSSRTPKYDSTCRIVSNDSGGLYINSSNKIQAVISSSVGDILTSDNAYHNFPQPIESDLYSAYTAMLNSSASVNQTPAISVVTKPENINTSPANIIVPTITKPDTLTLETPVINTPSTTSPVQPTSSSETTEIEQQISAVEKKINNAVDQGNLTDEKTFDILMDVATYQELQKKYEAAKAREQSIPNKLLGGLTMAATGVGGQMLATGLAEQRADEAAERDMRAYLATFRCDYGQGRNITGGETNIQLPGGNELLQFVTEYKQLAASLKSDKEALGIMPGIESEIISDSAVTGLYDDVSIGTQKGAFTSLSRALLDENSDDAKAWAEQTSAAHKKKNTGLTVGAVGAGAGLAGNTVINGILNKDKKSDQDASQNVDASNILNNANNK